MKFLLVAVLGGVVVWVFLEKLLLPLLPFVLGYLFAACVQPLLGFATQKMKLPRRLTAFFAVCVLTGAVGGLLYLLCGRIAVEARSLAGAAEDFLAKMQSDKAFSETIIDRINSLVPFFDVREPLRGFVVGLDGKLSALAAKAAGEFSGSILAFLASAAAFLPNAVLFLVVFLLAAYYFAVDYSAFHAAFRRLLPPKAAVRLGDLRKTVGEGFASFLRAYGLLMLITFSELFSALLVMGYRYAFLIALGTAVIDILPVLGTGTVLIPWAVITLLAGDTVRGVALLCVYAGMTVVRQVLEPRIVGKYIGLPPLAALACMYLGLRLFGVPGLVLFPVVGMVIWKM